jgi:hypothetical protein
MCRIAPAAGPAGREAVDALAMPPWGRLRPPSSFLDPAGCVRDGGGKGVGVWVCGCVGVGGGGRKGGCFMHSTATCAARQLA